MQGARDNFHPEDRIPVTELAARLRVSVSTAWSWVAKGILPQPERIGGPKARCTRWRWGAITEALKLQGGNEPRPPIAALAAARRKREQAEHIQA